jgi:glycosyltransferase involved in cell wall biosynthesis
VLVVTLRLPFPPVGGLSLRTWHFVRALATKHRVTVCGFTYGETISPPEFPVEIVPVPYTAPPLYEQMQSPDPEVSRRAYEQLATGTDEPWSASYFDCPAFGNRLRELATHADVVVIVGSSMGRFLPYLPASLPKMLDFPDVYTAMVERDPKAQSTAETERVRRFEQRVATACVRRVVCSSLERVRAREALGLPDVEVVSNGVDTKRFQPFVEPPVPGNLLFVGAMHYQPNADAAEYFVREIFPLIRRERPGTRLHIVGDSPPASVRALASDAVVVHGFVPDVRPFYRDAIVVVVPLLLGGGTRLKILEAAACGKAMVSTTLGAEGLEVRSGHDILLADLAEPFAAAVNRLQADADLRQQLELAARRTSKQYDWEQLGAKFVAITQAAADSVSGGTAPGTDGQSR